MKVKDLMSSPVYVIAPEEGLSHARNFMLRHEISRLAVVDGGLPVGIITKSDLVRHLSTLRLDVKVKDIMSDFVVMVHRHHSIGHVIAEMDKNDVHRVIVMEDGNTPVGIITSSNLAFAELKALLGAKSSEM